MTTKYATKFLPASPSDLVGSSFRGYLPVSYSDLVAKLGTPHDRTKEGEWYSLDKKVRVEWAFKSTIRNSPVVLTIYDYKDVSPIESIDLWNVGVKGKSNDIKEFLEENGINAEIRSRYFPV